MRLQSTLIILLATLLSLPLVAQNDPPPPPPEPEEIFRVVEEMPRFPGCEEKVDRQQKQQCAQERLLLYVYENLEYPEAAKNGGKEGMAVISFVVQKDGSLGNIRAVRDPGLGMGDAAADVLRKMNEEKVRWIPGKQRGQAVPVNFNLPVRFRLSEEDKSRMSMDLDEEITMEDVDRATNIPRRPSRPAMVEEAPPPPPPMADVIEDEGIEEEAAVEMAPPPPPPPPRVEMEPEPMVDAPIADVEIEEDIADEAPPVPDVAFAPPPPRSPAPTSVEEVFKVVEDMPRFYSAECEGKKSRDQRRNCAIEELNSFIYSQLQYPAIARENGVEGTVVVSFIVEEDGSITNARVLRDIGAGCGREAIRLVNLMASPGQWLPGKQRGRTVRVEYNLPIKFRLTD